MYINIGAAIVQMFNIFQIIFQLRPIFFSGRTVPVFTLLGVKNLRYAYFQNAELKEEKTGQTKNDFSAMC